MNDFNILKYEIKDVKGFAKRNAENYEKVKELLEKIGISFEISDEDKNLTIYYTENDVNNKLKRAAGRRRKLAVKDNDVISNRCDDSEYLKRKFYVYYDVIYLLQSHTNKQVAEIMGMKLATYNRRKKKMLESNFYKNLDKDRLDDLEYLKNQEGGGCPF